MLPRSWFKRYSIDTICWSYFDSLTCWFQFWHLFFFCQEDPLKTRECSNVVCMLSLANHQHVLPYMFRNVPLCKLSLTEFRVDYFELTHLLKLRMWSAVCSQRICIKPFSLHLFDLIRDFNLSHGKELGSSSLWLQLLVHRTISSKQRGNNLIAVRGSCIWNIDRRGWSNCFVLITFPSLFFQHLWEVDQLPGYRRTRHQLPEGRLQPPRLGRIILLRSSRWVT